MRYYIYKDGNVVGPYEPTQLPQLGLTANSQLCAEGSNDWYEAKYYQELAFLFPKSQSSSSNGLIGMIASIVALVAQYVVVHNGWLNWPAELIVTAIGIFGLIKSIKGFKDPSKAFATIGLILNIAGLIWSILCYIVLLGIASIKAIDHAHRHGLFDMSLISNYFLYYKL